MKYQLMKEDFVVIRGSKLHRIKALKDLVTTSGDTIVKQGELGGMIESHENLSHDGNCWVSMNSMVSGCAKVSDNAHVSGNSVISGHAAVGDNAHVQDSYVSGHSKVRGKAVVVNYSKVCDNAYVGGHSIVNGAFVCDSGWVGGDAIVSGIVNDTHWEGGSLPSKKFKEVIIDEAAVDRTLSRKKKELVVGDTKNNNKALKRIDLQVSTHRYR